MKRTAAAQIPGVSYRHAVTNTAHPATWCPQALHGPLLRAIEMVDVGPGSFSTATDGGFRYQASAKNHQWAQFLRHLAANPAMDLPAFRAQPGAFQDMLSDPGWAGALANRFKYQRQKQKASMTVPAPAVEVEGAAPSAPIRRTQPGRACRAATPGRQDHQQTPTSSQPTVPGRPPSTRAAGLPQQAGPSNNLQAREPASAQPTSDVTSAQTPPPQPQGRVRKGSGLHTSRKPAKGPARAAPPGAIPNKRRAKQGAKQEAKAAGAPARYTMVRTARTTRPVRYRQQQLRFASTGRASSTAATREPTRQTKQSILGQGRPPPGKESSRNGGVAEEPNGKRNKNK